MSDAASRLFVYGTLKDRAFIERLLGRTMDDPEEATLSGYASLDSNHGYPYAQPQVDSQIAGFLWTGLTAEDFRRLDRYEGVGSRPPLYRRTCVTARTASA